MVQPWPPSSPLRAELVGGLDRWHLTLPVSSSRKQYPADEVKQTNSTPLNKYSGPFFKLNDSKDAIVMTALYGGSTTSLGTAYARSELRERDANYDLAAWSCKSAVRAVSLTSSIEKTPLQKPEMSIAQIHDGDSDNLEVQYVGPANANGKTDTGIMRAVFNGSRSQLVLDRSYTIGQKVSVKLYTKGDGKMYVDYKNLATGETTSVSEAYSSVVGSCYFKVGNYQQACTKTNVYGGINSTCANKGWAPEKYETEPLGTSIVHLYALSLN